VGHQKMTVQTPTGRGQRSDRDDRCKEGAKEQEKTKKCISRGNEFKNETRPLAGGDKHKSNAPGKARKLPVF